MSDLHPHHIELDTGVEKIAGVTASRIFWIDVVEIDGGRFGLWLGHNYAEAIEIAEKARVDFEIASAVVDLVGGAG